jgi:hypothetical protein
MPAVIWARALLLEFGYRDDYAIVREVIEEPGKIILVCMSEGRLFYGILLEASFSIFNGVPGLAVWRMAGALLIGLTGALLARVLCGRFGWSAFAAAATGVLFVLLPSAQLIAAWASCWPQALAGLLAIAAFEFAERARGQSGARRRLSFFGAFALLVVAALTYQSNTLLYVVPLAAGWLTRHAERRDWRWLGAHLGLVGAALTCAFLVSVASFELFGFLQSRRFVVERDPIGKLTWFLRFPLREALGLFVLRDTFSRTEPWYTTIQALTAVLIAGGLVLRTTPAAAARRTAGLILLIMAAYAVSFAATERWPTYRTIWPLAGVLLVAGIAGARRWATVLPGNGAGPDAAWHPGQLAAAAAVVVAAWTSAWNVEWLLARPQTAEWTSVLRIAAAVDPARRERVFLLLPRPSDAAAPIRHLDEFGSLSADGDWVAKEMFKQAIRRVHPGVPTAASRFTWQSGYLLPRSLAARVFDLRPTIRVAVIPPADR